MHRKSLPCFGPSKTGPLPPSTISFIVCTKGLARTQHQNRHYSLIYVGENNRAAASRPHGFSPKNPRLLCPTQQQQQKSPYPWRERESGRRPPIFDATYSKCLSHPHELDQNLIRLQTVLAEISRKLGQEISKKHETPNTQSPTMRQEDSFDR